jgi:hypothetical protein
MPKSSVRSLDLRRLDMDNELCMKLWNIIKNTYIDMHVFVGLFQEIAQLCALN